MDIATKTIREIALESPATTRVFEEFKIDYCCGGRRSIEDACLAAGIDPLMLKNRLLATFDVTPEVDVPERLGPSELIDHIVATHHVFTAQELERLTALMTKVLTRHGELQPELYELRSVFSALAASLLPHMQKEEMVLFPYIHALERSLDDDASLEPPHFGTVANPIRMMMMDHDNDGERLRKMRSVTGDYSPPEGACPSFTALYAGLQDLERDLHRHIHLENNVLFPAATELEQRVLAQG